MNDVTNTFDCRVCVLRPGVSSLITLLVSAQGEEQPRLNVMLCEAVVAVYLSLLIHGMGTHSGNELFRLAAHPLNNRMWAAIFGGGAKVVIKPKRPTESPGRDGQTLTHAHSLTHTHTHTQYAAFVSENHIRSVRLIPHEPGG